MTTDMGRKTVSYLVRCALGMNDTLVKQDQNGAYYTFKGAIGLAPQYKTAGCNKDCTEELSACLMAHVNTTGVHIPLWLDSPMSSVGWGQSPFYPMQEGTFFGQIMVTNASNNLDAYYCNGPQVAVNEVPGRLGSNQGPVPYSNAYPLSAGMDGLCATSGHCVMQSNGDGAVSCVGNGTTWTHPLTVWRGQTFQAETATRTGAAAVVSCPQCGGGNRVGYVDSASSVTFKGVHVAATGTANLVLYYEDADTAGTTRAFNVSVNGGPVQYRTFAPVGGSWSNPSSVAVGSVNIALHGFVAGSNNTVAFSGDGVHTAPDLDWIEVMAGVGGANDPNLVGYWNFDEAQGTIIRDASAKASDGTLFGSTQWSGDLPPKIAFGNTSSLGFSATNTFVEVGTANLPATNAPQSVAAWIKLNSTSGGQYIVSMWDVGSTSGVSFGIQYGQLQAFAWGPRTLVSTSKLPSTGVWHHVAYTFDGITHKLYLDGALVSTGTAAPDVHAVTRAQLGAFNSGSSFNGLLDDIRIYKTALTAGQAANLAAGYASDQGG
jgi:hypothetical protein